MKYILFIILSTFTGSSPVDMTSIEAIAYVSPRIQRQYDEVAHSFTIEGVPIHPLVINRYFTAPSDFGPELISINLTDALRCNDTYGWDVEPKQSWEPLTPHTHAQFPEEWQRHDCEGYWFAEPDTGYIGYRRLGILKGDVQVIKFYMNNGGSMTWSTILLLQPKIRTIWSAPMGTWSPKHIVELQLIGECSGTFDDEYILKKDRITVQELHEIQPNNPVAIFDPFDIWVP